MRIPCSRSRANPLPSLSPSPGDAVRAVRICARSGAATTGPSGPGEPASPGPADDGVGAGHQTPSAEPSRCAGPAPDPKNTPRKTKRSGSCSRLPPRKRVGLAPSSRSGPRAVCGPDRPLADLRLQPQILLSRIRLASVTPSSRDPAPDPRRQSDVLPQPVSAGLQNRPTPRLPADVSSAQADRLPAEGATASLLHLTTPLDTLLLPILSPPFGVQKTLARGTASVARR